MPNPAQKEVLESYIGEEGFNISAMKEDERVNLGTKLLYLERAISQNGRDFLQSLDKLYNPELEGQAKEANLEFIQTLKLINDLCFNNEVKFGDFGNRKALDHHFGALGDINPQDFQTTVQAMIRDRMTELHVGHEQEANAQKAQREADELNMERQTEWRSKLDLPANQLVQPDAPQVQHGVFHPQDISQEIQIFIRSLISQESRDDLFQECSVAISNRPWVFISVEDMPQRLNQLAQYTEPYISEDAEFVKNGIWDCVARAIAYAGTTQQFFMNKVDAKDILASALILGQYHHNDDLKNHALDLISNMHLKDTILATIENTLYQQFMPGFGM